MTKAGICGIPTLLSATFEAGVTPGFFFIVFAFTMQHQPETDWPKDLNTLKGYKIYKNVPAIITNWIIRPGQATLCLADIANDNKPAHIDRAMISVTGTCPREFKPENFSEGDHIVVELCEPSKGYSTTAMANYICSTQKPFPQKDFTPVTAKQLLDKNDSTTKIVITNVPKALKDSWDVHCKQQGLKPWRAFKDLLDKEALPF